VNNQLRMLSGNKNQQTDTSTALKPTEIRSSRRSVNIRRYSDLTAVETSVRLSSLAMALIVLLRQPLSDFSTSHRLLGLRIICG
jgi:hypothetical protein